MKNIKCHSSVALTTEIESVRSKICLEETEESWDTIAKGISHLSTLCNNGACDFPTELVAELRALSRPLTNSMNSERTRLSGAAIELMGAVAAGLGSHFEPLLPLFLPTLLNLCSRANKVFTTRARSCILILIESSQLPSILPYLIESLGSKSAPLRLAATESILGCMNCFNPPDLERESRARLVEEAIRVTARDASADIRKISKKIFEAYKTLLPTRVDSFVAPLTPVIKKYLDVREHPAASGRGIAPKSQAKPQLHTQLTVALNDVADRVKGHSRSASSSSHLSTGSIPKRPVTKQQIAPEANPSSATHAPVQPQPYIRGRANTLRSVAPPSVAILASTTSRLPTSSSQTISRTTSREGVRRPDAPPSRPKSVLGRLDPPMVAPAPPVHRGPLRPEKVKSQGDLRASASEQDGKPRMVGGARRVPITVPVTVPAEIPAPTQELDENELKVIKKATSRPASRTDNAARSAAPLKTSTSSTRHPPFQPTKSKDGTQRAPSRAEASKSTSTAVRQPTSLQSSQGSVRPDMKPTQLVAPRSRNVTNPTMSQLARMNAAKETRKTSDNSVKPTWGRAAPANTGKATTKPLVIKDKAGAGKPTVVQRKEAKLDTKTIITEPESVPLPPTPSPTVQPASLPLPLPPLPSSETQVPPPEEEEEREKEFVVEDDVSTPLVTEEVDDGAGLEEDTRETPEPQLSPPRATSVLPQDAVTRTPISTLLSSIERGFLFTPSSPLSPPQSYLPLKQQAHDPNAPFGFFGSHNNQEIKAIPNFFDDTPSQDSEAMQKFTTLTAIPPLAKPVFGEDINRQALVDVDTN